MTRFCCSSGGSSDGDSSARSAGSSASDNGREDADDCCCSYGKAPTAYQLLGVPLLASQEEIRRAWRSACLRHHPDRHQGDLEATKKFQALQSAYEGDCWGEPLLAVADRVAVTVSNYTLVWPMGC